MKAIEKHEKKNKECQECLLKEKLLCTVRATIRRVHGSFREKLNGFINLLDNHNAQYDQHASFESITNYEISNS